MADKRKSGLTTLDLHRLDRACEPVWNAVGRTYLVGTAQDGGPYRDVDVRTILDDEEFDRLFGEGSGKVERHDNAPLGKGRSLWSLLCVSVGQMLSAETGLPIDYQIQRRTQANETYKDSTRNPVGRGMRVYAGGGDATWFDGHRYAWTCPVCGFWQADARYEQHVCEQAKHYRAGAFENDKSQAVPDA